MKTTTMMMKGQLSNHLEHLLEPAWVAFPENSHATTPTSRSNSEWVGVTTKEKEGGLSERQRGEATTNNNGGNKRNAQITWRQNLEGDAN